MSRKMTGIVKTFDRKSGKGFIIPSDGRKEVQVHISAFTPRDAEVLIPGLRVEFCRVNGLRGPTAADVAANHGVSLDGHAGRKLTAEMARNYDLILAMESEHIAQVTAIAPEVRGKTMLFGQWLEQKEIPDPYRKSQDAFEHVYGMLERASQEWAKRLSR
ncbi:cold shock-like protein CspH [Escherichia coli]|nr:cold shock-like protein CspH [Escherichia coli]EJH8475732.1 cold shock-like protein CspH [Escherichia coli]ELC6204740.1 cold shock-like protein CspH [Escherichia coli]EMD3257079.1 cold shock-like protein CspH [Escherichia coli]MDZ6968699.1 cold shock-like protein CspH [Escherichia coli]GCK98773.1 O-antigen capsule forming protein-tyrosine-phosphatase [Escherichia coli]